MNNTMINDQRRKFRQWARDQYQAVANAPDLDAALACYSSAMSALHLVELIFPDEPLELTRGNLRVNLEERFTDLIEKIK